MKQMFEKRQLGISIWIIVFLSVVVIAESRVAIMPRGFEKVVLGMSSQQLLAVEPTALPFDMSGGAPRVDKDQTKLFIETLDEFRIFNYASYTFFHDKLCGANFVAENPNARADEQYANVYRDSIGRLGSGY